MFFTPRLTAVAAAVPVAAAIFVIVVAVICFTTIIITTSPQAWDSPTASQPKGSKSDEDPTGGASSVGLQNGLDNAEFQTGHPVVAERLSARAGNSTAGTRFQKSGNHVHKNPAFPTSSGPRRVWPVRGVRTCVALTLRAHLASS